MKSFSEMVLAGFTPDLSKTHEIVFSPAVIVPDRLQAEDRYHRVHITPSVIVINEVELAQSVLAKKQAILEEKKRG